MSTAKRAARGCVFGNSEHLWCVLEHGVTSVWGQRAGANVSSELHGDLMKQQQPHQRSTRINFRRKIKTLHSWSIILFNSARCWSHSCCPAAAAPGRARSVSVHFLRLHHSWLCPAPWHSLPWDPVLLLCRALLRAQPPVFVCCACSHWSRDNSYTLALKIAQSAVTLCEIDPLP